LTFKRFAGIFVVDKEERGLTMFNMLERKHWLLLSLLLFINVTIFGCLVLLLTGRIAP